MRFMATADTDVGTVKKTNQDSVLFKHAVCGLGEVMMAIVCDGMGGLAKGELASAQVIRAFDKWFDEELPRELEQPDMQVIGAGWALFLKELNSKILDYSQSHGGDSMGTTFSGILFVGDEYVIAHVGDSRVYSIHSGLTQLTEDHTFVAREIKRGNMTPEQARKDRRRNMLLQCVGASRTVEPQVVCGRTQPGTYVLCSDGFRHEITEEEIRETLDSTNLIDKKTMHGNARYLINQVKARGERDNISVIVVKVER